MKNKPYNQTEAITTYTVNDHYQVTAGPAAMSWNDNGYLTARGADDFAWTALGQLAQAAMDGGSTLDYLYDAFGWRVKTTNGTQVNRFLYHGWHMIGEWDDTADEWLWQEAPWNEGERMLEHIALDTSDVDGDVNVSEYRQYAVHEDFQDTVWGLSGTDAAIAERYNYTDPYGQSDSEDGAANALGDFATEVFQRKRLHGGFVELEAELYDFRNRWLASGIGGFVSRDPVPFWYAPNRFEFCAAYPLRLVDPNGTAPDDCFEYPVEECGLITWISQRFCNSAQAQYGRSLGGGSAEVIGALCDGGTDMECTCKGCVRIGDDKVRCANTTKPSGRPLIRFEYFPRGINIVQSKKVGGGGIGRDIETFPCCPCCKDLATTVLHEAIHAACLMKHTEEECRKINEGSVEEAAQKLLNCLRFGQDCDKVNDSIDPLVK